MSRRSSGVTVGLTFKRDGSESGLQLSHVEALAMIGDIRTSA